MKKKHVVFLVLFTIFLPTLGAFDLIGTSSALYKSIEIEEYGFFNNISSFSFNSEKQDEDGLTHVGLKNLNSYNSHYKHGMNDESFWQGKGINSFLTGGIVLNKGNFRIVLYPEIWIAQNKSFDIVDPASVQENEYAFYISHIDNPQRYGDDIAYSLGLGQSEIRYTGERFTIGVGYQSLWVGPSRFSSLLLSNNAGGFPKVDFGFRNIETKIGEFELFGWWGILQESEYFNSDSSDDYNLFSGFHFDYSPKYIEGFTFGFNRTLTANLTDAGLSSYGTLYIPYMSTLFGQDQNDQRASVTLEWDFPSVGFNAYAEWARNDYQPSLRSLIQFPQRTEAYTIGVSQIVKEAKQQKVVATLEITDLLISWDYTIDDAMRSGVSFYTHGIVDQGYTQQGQIVGAGIGTGSNSQIFNIDWFLEDNYFRFFIQRIGRSPDYLFSLPYGSSERSSSNNNVELTGGIEWEYQISEAHTTTFGFEYSRNLNWNFISGNDVNNFYLSTGYKVSY